MVKFEKTREGNHRFIVKSSTGANLLTSTEYHTLSDAELAHKELKKQPLFERNTNHDGEFIVVFKNSAGAIVGKSNGYDSEAGMENGLQNLLKNL